MNDLNLGAVIVDIRADIAGLKKGLDEANHALKSYANTTKDTEVKATAAFAVIAVACGKAFNIIENAVNRGVSASEQYKASLIGLTSIANGRGLGTDKILKELDSLVDGFFDVGSASTAFKNLLMRGYSTEQAINSIKRLKDAAAFGRQASYDLAGAVVTATEGLKNENSILVDNAGVTKNVSIMWKEYAASIGTTVGQLTQAQKIEAEYQGIMRETQYQVGDLQKSMQTLSGKQSENAQNARILAQEYGKSLTPAVALLTQAKSELLKVVTGLTKLNPELTSGVTTATISIVGLIGAFKGIQAIQAFNKQLTIATQGLKLFGMSASTLTPVIAGISAVIGLATALYSNYVNKQEEAKRKAEEQARAEQERIKALKSSVEEIQKTTARYEELKSKTHLTKKENEELNKLQTTLQQQFAKTGSSVSTLKEGYNGLLEKLKEYNAEQRKGLITAQKQGINEAKKAYDEARALGERNEKLKESEQAYQRVLNAHKALYHGDLSGTAKKEAEAEYQRATINFRTNLMKNGLDASIAEKGFADVKEYFARIRKEIGDAPDTQGKWAEVVKREFELAELEAEQSGKTLNSALKESLKPLFEGLAGKTDGMDLSGLMTAYVEAISSADTSKAIEAVKRLNKKIMDGGVLSAGEQKQLQSSFDVLTGITGSLSKNITSATGEYKHFSEILRLLVPEISDFIPLMGKAGEESRKLAEYAQGLKVGDILSPKTTEEAQKQAESISKITDKLKETSESEFDTNAILKALEVLKQAFADTASVSAETLENAKAKLTELGVAVPETLEQTNNALANHTGILTQQSQEQALAYQSAITMLETYKQALSDLEANGMGETEDAGALKGVIGTLEEAIRKAQSLNESLNNLTFDIKSKSSESEIAKIEKQVSGLQKSFDKMQMGKALITSLRTTAREAKNTGKSAQGMSRDFKDAFKRVTGVDFNGNFDDAINSLKTAGDGLKQQGDYTLDVLDNIKAELEKNFDIQMQQIALNPDIKLDLTPFYRVASQLNAMYAQLGSSQRINLGGRGGGGGGRRGGGGGGGGGGGKGKSQLRIALEELTHDAKMGRLTLEQELERLKNISHLANGIEEQREIAEAIRDKAEEVRKARLEADYGYIDHKKSLDSLSITEEIRLLERIKHAHALNAEELKDIDEKLHEARKRKAESVVEWELAILEHKKALDQTTTEQEIDTLRSILRAHTLTAEKRMELIERIYSLEKELNEKQTEREKASIESVYNKLTESLKKKLEAEKDAELKRLDSKLQALDALTNAENEANRKREYQERLSEKRRELEVTKSARKRRELRAEIEKMERDEELKQKQLARQDEKSKLQDERKAIQDKYTALADEENIRQEAFRLVMSNNLGKITEIISSYGSKWENAGQELAERLTNGIIGGRGAIIGALTELEERLKSQAMAKLGYYNSPIPTPNAGNKQITINMNGTTIREEADIDKLAKELYKKIG